MLVSRLDPRLHQAKSKALTAAIKRKEAATVTGCSCFTRLPERPIVSAHPP
jgi:hypothetical protein